MNSERSRIFLSKLKSRYVISITVGILLFCMPFFIPRITRYMIIALQGSLLALAINFFYGYCGRIHFGAAAFVGIGAYCSALFQSRLGMPFVGALFLSLGITALVALALSPAILRIKGAMLALGTFSIALIVYQLMACVFTNFTGGDDGIMLPAVVVLGKKMGSWFYYSIFFIATVACFYISETVLKSRIGRAMSVIRVDDIAAQSLGINTKKYVAISFVISAIMLGLGGALYAQWVGWISPEYYGVMGNVAPLLGVIVGGIGIPLGAIWGGALISILPILLIRIEYAHPIIFGTIFALIIRFAPDGIFGTIRKLKGRKANRNNGNTVDLEGI